MKKIHFSIAFLLGCFALSACTDDSTAPDSRLSDKTITDNGLSETYWQHPLAKDVQKPSGWSQLETNLHPEACAQCHADQFNAWKHSRHAAAYSPGLVGQFPAMGHVEGNNCLQCHAPLAEQLYGNAADMMDSIRLRLKHPVGFSYNADLSAVSGKNSIQLPLRHSGVSCAVCHVRGWHRNGPPQRGTGAVGHVDGSAHGGFRATSAFEQSQFCASCHQFPQSMAINGKPLENTVQEWKRSRFSGNKGTPAVHCQQCHMPDRKHAFKGIHDKQMTRSGLAFSLKKDGDSALFSIQSVHIGHAFPTYVTPRIEIIADTMAADGRVLKSQTWEIMREVAYADGWQEVRDTRLLPGEVRDYRMPVGKGVVAVKIRVQVIPDAFYKGVYKDLLADDVDALARQHLEQALADAKANDYLLYRKTLTFKQHH